MGIGDWIRNNFGRREPETVDSITRYCGKAFQNGRVNGQAVNYLRGIVTHGEKLVARYFQMCDSDGIPLKEEHTHRDYVYVSQDRYVELQTRINSGEFSESNLQALLHSTDDYHGDLGILIKIFRDKGKISIQPRAQLSHVK